jgi:hypothetical protein
LLILLAHASTGSAQVVYSTDFESGAAGSEWSNRKVAVTPSGRSFLGPFMSESADLTLTIPEGMVAPGVRVRVTFDLFIIESWDGNADGCSPPGEEWSFAVDGATPLRTTFSNAFAFCGNRQMYPAAVGMTYAYPGQTGAAEVNTLGYGSGLWGDSVYRMAFVLAGVVDLYVDGRPVAQVAVMSSSASLTLTGLARGDHQVIAVFTSSSVDYSGSTARAAVVSVR